MPSAVTSSPDMWAVAGMTCVSSAVPWATAATARWESTLAESDRK